MRILNPTQRETVKIRGQEISTKARFEAKPRVDSNNFQIKKEFPEVATDHDEFMWVTKGPSHLMYDLHCRNLAEREAIAKGKRDSENLKSNSGPGKGVVSNKNFERFAASFRAV